METNQEKVDNLTERIENLNYEIDDLLQIKINLMMIRHDYNMKDVRKSLEECFSPGLKKMLEEKLKDEIDG